MARDRFRGGRHESAARPRVTPLAVATLVLVGVLGVPVGTAAADTGSSPVPSVTAGPGSATLSGPTASPGTTVSAASSTTAGTTSAPSPRRVGTAPRPDPAPSAAALRDAGADLAVTGSAPDIIAYGAYPRFSFTVRNTGDAASEPTVLTVQSYAGSGVLLPDECTRASGTSTTYTCQVRALSPGESVRFDMGAHASGDPWGSTRTVTAQVEPVDANPDNDSATLVLHFAEPTTFAITVTGPGPTVVAGQHFTVTVSATNTGNSPGVFAFVFSYDERLRSYGVRADPVVLCGGDIDEWECSSDAVEAGRTVPMTFDFTAGADAVGRRVSAGTDVPDTPVWSALVVAATPATSTTSAARHTTAAPAMSATASASPSAAELAMTGAGPVPLAASATLLGLAGVGLLLTGRRRPRGRHR